MHQCKVFINRTLHINGLNCWLGTLGVGGGVFTPGLGLHSEFFGTSSRLCLGSDVKLQLILVKTVCSCIIERSHQSMSHQE